MTDYLILPQNKTELLRRIDFEWVAFRMGHWVAQ